MFNSFIQAIFIVGLVATIMIRTLRLDVTGYIEMQALREENMESAGWGDLHGDVCRQPQTHPMRFGVLVGWGAQAGTAVLLTSMLSSIGVYNPMNRGEIVTALLLLYGVSGFVDVICRRGLSSFVVSGSARKELYGLPRHFRGSSLGSFWCFRYSCIRPVHRPA